MFCQVVPLPSLRRARVCICLLPVWLYTDWTIGDDVSVWPNAQERKWNELGTLSLLTSLLIHLTSSNFKSITDCLSSAYQSPHTYFNEVEFTSYLNMIVKAVRAIIIIPNELKFTHTLQFILTASHSRKFWQFLTHFRILIFPPTIIVTSAVLCTRWEQAPKNPGRLRIRK